MFQSMNQLMTLQDIQKQSLNILNAVDSFCEKNNIIYSLGYGSLLGAIRHKGFIPWDDDIDIMLTRPEYNKLIHSFHCDGLTCIAPELGNSYMTFGRIVDVEKTRSVSMRRWAQKDNNLGLWIDVFPIDGVPDDIGVFKTAVESMQESIRMNERIREGKHAISSSYSLRKNLSIIKKKLLFGWLSTNSYWNKMMSELDKSPFGSTNYAGLMVFPYYGLRNRTRTKVFESYMKTPFEEYEFSIIQEYDEFLRDIYGDYMVLPPEDKRIPKHNVHKFYWNDSSFNQR